MRVIICTIAFCLGALGVRAQDVQVSFDQEGTVYSISQSLNNQFGIITGFDGFIEARLFRSGTDTTYTLEVVTERNGQRSRTTRTLTLRDVQALRERVSSIRAEAAPTIPASVPVAGLDQNGRTSLLWGSTLWSLFYYGTATSIALDLNNPSVPILLAGGLGYLVPALITSDLPVTDGAASLALGGMFQGTIHGWALAAAIGGQSLFNSDTPRLGFGLSVLTGVTESIAGYLVATNTNMSEGRAGVINTTSFYGMLSGVLLTAAVFDQVDPSSDVAARTLGGMALAGAAAGIVAGDAIADAQHFSPGDATIYGITGLLGAGLPVVVMAAIQPDNFSGTATSLLCLGGTVGGLWVGTALTKGYDYPASDGTVSIISLLGGGAIGLGLSQALDVAPESVALMSYAGALGGFCVSLALAKPQTPTQSTSWLDLDVDVNPMGPLVIRQDLYGIQRPDPFVVARLRF